MEESIKELTMAAFDRFSEMPEHIVHHIMSFLPTTSATRVSALSKKFNSAWLSYPVFDFDQALYEEVIRPSGDRTSCKKPDFLDFVLASLTNRCPSNIYIQRFSLRAWPREISDNGIQNSIRLAADCNVSLEFEELIPCLNLVEDLSLERCSVSANFMLSSDKLTDLNLRFCKGLEKIEIDALNLQSFSYFPVTRRKATKKEH